MVYDLSVPEPKDASTAFLIHVDRDRDVGGGSFDCLSRKFLMHGHIFTIESVSVGT